MSTQAVPVALAAAACFALASVLQQRAVLVERSHPALDPRLLLRVLRRPLWLVGEIADLAGVGLQTVALAAGALAVVQPLLVSGLVLAIPLGAALDRRRPGVRELVAVVLAGAGLSAFLLTATPAGGVADPSVHAWIVIAAVAGPAVAGCLAVAQRSTGNRRATFLGVATGGLYGVTSALLKTNADRLAAGHDPLLLLGSWQLWVLLAVGGAGLALNQNAFQDGALAASLTALTVTEPAVGVVIGVTAFHEHLSVDGLRAPLLVAAAAAMTWGVWLAGNAGARPREAAGDHPH